ncbi:hypothetical protein MUP95_07315 [bacterium]|nr:hypothetical protein [bacterium]
MFKKRIIFVFLVGASMLQAQMAGNPAGVKGQGKWTVSAIGTYMNQQIGNEEAVSKRVLLRSTWGLAPWLDVYGMVGGVQLDLKTSNVDFIDYEGKFRLGYGAGFNVAFQRIAQSRFWIWIGGQALRYSSQGSFFEESDIFMKEFKMDYDSREFLGHAGIVIPFKSFRLYGAGVGWTIQRLESKTEYLEYGGMVNTIGQVDGEFRSGLRPDARGAHKRDNAYTRGLTLRCTETGRRSVRSDL